MKNKLVESGLGKTLRTFRAHPKGHRKISKRFKNTSKSSCGILKTYGIPQKDSPAVTGPGPDQY